MIDMLGEKSDIECFFLLQMESDSLLCSLRNWCFVLIWNVGSLVAHAAVGTLLNCPAPQGLPCPHWSSVQDADCTVSIRFQSCVQIV